MSNIPRSLTDSSVSLFKLAISASDSWPFSLLFFWLLKTICFFFQLYIREIIRMGSEGDKKGHSNFHLHMPHIHFHHHHHDGRPEARRVPKGCLAIMVGQGEEQRRFIVPVIYVNHPLFTQLLKDAEEEYGFYQTGAINIPCHVEEFCEVRGIIDKETTSHPQHHHHHFLCFKA